MMSVPDCAGGEATHHVLTRTPCVFSHLPPELCCLSQLVSLESVQSLQVDELVEIEVRAEKGRAYGNGQKRSMKLQKFLTQLSQGNKNLYLTTQEAQKDTDGFPELLTAPLNGLVNKGLPVKPSVMGNLVPHSINLWIGCSKDGSSSGLHHDFHDNLYVLLCGRKRFRLYPPETARRMYTHGQVSMIHSNGRIVYEGQGAVHADGSDTADVRRWRLKRRADGVIKVGTSQQPRYAAGRRARGQPATAEESSESRPGAEEAELRVGVGRAAVSAGGSGAAECGNGGSDVSRDGSDIEDALEAALDAAACGDVGFSSEEEWHSSGDGGGGDDSDGGVARARGAGSPSSGSECQCLGLCEGGCSRGDLLGVVMRARGSGGSRARKRKAAAAKQPPSTTKPPRTAAPAGARTIQEAAPATDEDPPCSFSQVDLGLPEVELKRRFPLFPGVVEAVEVVVEAGQALYLPASWFHEVTSFGSGDNCMHVAVNYWFHPPDNLAEVEEEVDAAVHGDRVHAQNACDQNNSNAHEAACGTPALPQGMKMKGRGGSEGDGDAWAGHVHAEHACAGQYPYKTDFWPCMWNARVDRHAWPQHLKVPLSGRD